MEHHKQIWLEPQCEKCVGKMDNRMWCEDPVFDPCEECGAKPVRYVLDKRQH